LQQEGAAFDAGSPKIAACSCYTEQDPNSELFALRDIAALGNNVADKLSTCGDIVCKLCGACAYVANVSAAAREEGS
jgi:hypothetical protein